MKICWLAVLLLLSVHKLINSLEQDTSEMPLFAQTDFVIKHSGLYQMYQQEKVKKASSN